MRATSLLTCNYPQPFSFCFTTGHFTAHVRSNNPSASTMQEGCTDSIMYNVLGKPHGIIDNITIWQDVISTDSDFNVFVINGFPPLTKLGGWVGKNQGNS